MDLGYILKLIADPIARAVDYVYAQLFNSPQYVEGAIGSSATIISGTKIFLVVFGFVLNILVLIILFQLMRLRKEEHKRFKERFIKSPHDEVKEVNQKWSDIEGHVSTDRKSDWTIAVIEADKILDDLLRERGLSGEGVGEMLKQLDRNSFRSLDDVWEAHKIRNKIAHESGYELTQRDARKAIEFYGRVFRELGYLN